MAVSEQHIEKSIAVAKEYGINRLILFGSALEQPEQARDIDLACDGLEGWKLFEFAGRLEDELNILVDIVPLSPPTPFSRYIESKGKILI